MRPEDLLDRSVEPNCAGRLVKRGLRGLRRLTGRFRRNELTTQQFLQGSPSRPRLGRNSNRYGSGGDTLPKVDTKPLMTVQQ